mmetsp:Transcript_3309/g.5706  ORF Transcript_3309/g.5706 Transcript_3309/m.5706 type:complete len:251 (+) Transcript_3309:562-1314(+)
MRHSLHAGLRALQRVPRFEDAAPHEHAIHTELHHEGAVRWAGDPARGEVHHGELPVLVHPLEELERALHVLGRHKQLVLLHGLDPADLRHERARVPHRFNDVACSRFALGAKHGRPLCDSAKSFAQVAAPAHERHRELVLVDVVVLVRHGEHLRLVDVVHLDGFQDLGLHVVADARLGHDGDGHRRLDGQDHLRVRHARHAAVGADVGGDALEGHDRAGPRFFRELGLLNVHHVHDHASLEGLRHAALDS